jgi:anthranilate synthase component 1
MSILNQVNLFMSAQLSQKAFLELARSSKRIAVHRVISAGALTVKHIAESLAAELEEGAIVETGLTQPEKGHYAYFSLRRIGQISVQNDIVTQHTGDKIFTSHEQPFTALRQFLANFSYKSQLQKVPFLHSAVGFMTYDAIRLFENIPDRHQKDETLPEMVFSFYETTVILDNSFKELTVSILVETDGDLKDIYAKAQLKITALMDKIFSYVPGKNSSITSQKPFFSKEKVDIEDTEFVKMVEQAKRYIAAGEAFQIVLSRCFTRNYTVTPLKIYNTLRKISPAPYMFYLPLDTGVIAGASPEKLISVRKREVETHPIAGTRPRIQSENTDKQIEEALLNDKKEVAEHIMLVDLARNDIGRVCKAGSVKVHEFLKVKHFSHISHITSVVTGKLDENKDALDALKAAFPAGTLSGAPKIRAMEIIDEIETSRRQLYGGAICRIDVQGNLESCIAIRFALLKNNIATVRTGAGIVYDSHPKSEANETKQKAKSILEAIGLAEEDAL